MTVLKFMVPGKPAPQGSKSFKGYRGGRPILVESCRELGPWRDRIALVAHDVMRTDGVTQMLGAVIVTLSFTLPRPKSTPKLRTPPAVKRPDIDKLSRAVLDALTHVVLLDDSQVVELHATKRIAEIGETTGVEITVEAL
jgi:crossover junction endodeoxyribonuclease RusA